MDVSDLPTLDARLRAALQGDERITHAAAYGSVPQGTADEYSDLEYWAFLAPGTGLDARRWLEALVPVVHFVVNEFGTSTAILPGLRRVELHVVSQERLPEIEGWTPEHVNPARMLVKDTDGRLARHLAVLASRAPDPAGETQGILDRTLNWLTFGLNVLARGERIRALEVLWWVQGGLLRLARLHAGHTGHWGNASRRADQELDAASLERYASITATLDNLDVAYANAVSWTLELAPALQVKVDEGLATDLRSATGR
ncbi:hypothetical protein E7T09_17820 [Deinococcus sp. KSM4-11]|uniref:hypothetical protein n=1 Tax=Deinococcus sp. KSM4-11 TaxID=2568654 RepID=UPI0010A3175E|nr:hypothetical protein [Deinococcus sp. KSM4-11]THF85337.1 hypothetical protein E7T09_17820 [Deinococcus sp. KSM4-11]